MGFCNEDGSPDLYEVSGNTIWLQIEMEDCDGETVSIASAQEIIYKLARTPDSTPIITKTLGIGITMLPGGTSFMIKLDATDTEPLVGLYYHEARLTDIAGNLSTTFYSYNFEFSKNLIEG